MTDNGIEFHRCANPPLPDDILIYATRMFLPEVQGLNVNAMIAQAVSELRDIERRVKIHGVKRDKALWQAGDPVYIANYTMMFVRPQIAGDQRHHDWHGRLLRLLREREARFFPKTEGNEL